MSTLRDIAQEVGLSVSTVSRALSGHPHIGKATRERVQEAATRLGYQPNALARALRQNRTKLVGLVVPDTLNRFYAASTAVLQATLEASGYRVIVCITNNDPESEKTYLNALLQHQVDGIIHVPCAPTGAQVIRKTGSTIPVVELARYSESRLFDSVISDDREGALQLTRYLIGLGHRRIAIIAGNPPFSTTRARVQGFREAFQEANLPLDESLICCREYSPAWGAESLLALLRLHEPPTAVFAASNQLVLGAIRAARVAGLTIPRDLSLAGYDDPEWFPLWNAGITTYALPLQEMGLLAAQLLLARMSGHEGEATTAMPMLTRLSGHLIVRGSCAPLRSNKKGGTLSQAPSASSP